MRGSAKVYRWLLRLYPARFREEYQAPMERQFLDEYRETQSHWARVQIWQRALLDLASSIPKQRVCELWLDLKHGMRAYRSRALSTVFAVSALGLAIGASTGVFSVLNALLLRSLPFVHPEQLVELWMPAVGPLSGRAAFTAGIRQSAYLQGAAAFSSSEMNLSGGRDVLRVKVAETSANFFSLLGVNPAVGRTFLPDEDILGHNSVAVISYGLWQQLFDGDPHVTGKLLHLNGQLLTVIGVAPASFDYPGTTNLWIPTIFDVEKVPKRGAFLMQTIGRLKPGVSIRAARELFAAEIRHLHPPFTTRMSADERNNPHITSLQTQLAGPVRQAGWALAGMTLLVLLTACANVAHLLLSRVTERRQELAIRAALGASRARLLQQLTVEAMLLTMTSAVIGLLVAQWTCTLASSFVPAQLAAQQYTIFDWRVLGFACLVAIAMGVVFGSFPIGLAGRTRTTVNSMHSQQGLRELTPKRTRATLIGLQAALTVCLVTNSLALGRTFLHLLHVDLGFQPASVVTLNVALQGTRHYGHGEWAYYSEVLQRLRSIPGVEAAGAVSHLPLADNIYMAGSFKLDSGQTMQSIVTNSVTPDYFRAMGTRFLAGRDFARGEWRRSEASVIVNEAFAQAAGLGDRIVGRRLIAPWSRTTPYRIRGVVGTTRFGGPESEGVPEIYWPIQEEPPPILTLVAKVEKRPESYLALCRDAVRTVDSQVPIYDAKTLQRRLTEALARPKFYATATSTLAFLGMLLAVVGIYGSAVYSIAQRRHEMGVRLALGASQRRIRAMILRESARPVLVGMVAGVILAVASERGWESVLGSAAGVTFWACGAAAALLVSAALLASWQATERVLSIDPAEALRSE